MVVFGVFVQDLLFEIRSQFLPSNEKLLGLIDDDAGVFEGVEDGEIFLIEGFPPFFGFPLSGVLYF